MPANLAEMGRRLEEHVEHQAGLGIAVAPDPAAAPWSPPVEPKERTFSRRERNELNTRRIKATTKVNWAREQCLKAGVDPVEALAFERVRPGA